MLLRHAHEVRGSFLVRSRVAVSGHSIVWIALPMQEGWVDRETLVAWLLHTLEQGQQPLAAVGCLLPLLQLCIKVRFPMSVSLLRGGRT